MGAGNSAHLMPPADTHGAVRRAGHTARPQRNQLLAVAEQLAQLPLIQVGDSGLGQLAHPQQIHQIPGVADIVFTRR